ncbi:MAG: hypothetical protein HGA85_07890 [Nanoarchaeota archaeon]|nr:hypothetical protein [Nanoarchaeota archaeon]
MILKQGFIGKEVEIEYAGRIFNGKIAYESKNMLVLECGKKLVKMNSIIKIGNKKIIGAKITKRPEDRIKVC